MVEISKVQASPVVGVILAGGLARRMGNAAQGDKALLRLGDQPILTHVIERMRPQVDHLVINANGPPERFAAFGLPVVSDPIDGFVGPLAGVLAGMEWARDNVPEAKWIATIACDTPFFPRNLIERFMYDAAENQADMVCASTNGRNHPVVGLWPVALADELRYALEEEAVRKVDLWTGRYQLAVSAFDASRGDPFFNVNRPEDLERAEEMAQGISV